MGTVLKKGENDLQTKRPDLALQWHPTKNGGLTPVDVCVFSSRRVWWMIRVQRFGKEFSLEWESTVANRAGGTGCPYISHPPKKLLKGFNDLQSTNPELAKKWHPEKNGTVTPDMVFENTDRKYWWCHEAYKDGKMFLHEWCTSPKSMKQKNAVLGCPICHGMQVMEGYNDLASCFPEIAKDWDPERNDGLLPTQVTHRSSRQVFWRCRQCGNRWRTNVQNRTAHGTRCPVCAKRSQTSFPEQVIFFYLRQQFADCKNRAVGVLPRGELDIYIPGEKFAVEYCGLQAHRSAEKRNWDAEKRTLCQKLGIHLIQIFEDETKNICLPEEGRILCIPKHDHAHMNYVMGCLNEVMMDWGLLQQPAPVNIRRDERAVREQYLLSETANSLAEKFPEIAKEWDYERNGNLRPEGFSFGSNVQVYWRHKVSRNGVEFVHSWRGAIGGRTGKVGKNCPICAGKQVQAGYNDFYSANPACLTEWDYERNQLTPQEVTRCSRKLIWWRHEVEKNGEKEIHSWKMSPMERIRGRGCSVCAGKVIQKGINDLGTTHPELLEMWDYEKNTIDPSSISYGYDKKVWWKHYAERNGCVFAHSWSASPNSRTNRGSGCPYCANKKALQGYNDLRTLFPEIAEKWDHERNGELKPSDVTEASGKRVWWLDREKPIRICDRTRYLR